jgi:hypothetical protein
MANKLNKNTQAYKNKLKYIKEYGKLHSRQVYVQLNKEKDKDVLEFLETQPSKANYIRQLIRQDIQRRKESKGDLIC